MEVDGNINLRASSFTQCSKLFNNTIYKGYVLNDSGGTSAGDAGLERCKTFGNPLLDCLRIATALVQTDGVACGTTEQLVDRNTERFPRQILEGLLDATQRTGENRSAPIEGVAIHCLPVMDNAPWILPN